MILGMTTATFTLVHVLLSLAGIASGFIVVYGLLTGKRLDGWTAIFLATTVLTSVTGFLFPVEHLLPSHVVGAISLVVLAVAIVALCVSHGAGLAMDLCGLRRCGAVFEFLCGGGAVVSEGVSLEGTGSDAERAAIPDCPTCAHGALYRDWRFCGEEVPHRAGGCDALGDPRQVIRGRRSRPQWRMPPFNIRDLGALEQILIREGLMNSRLPIVGEGARVLASG
jgi:hypothetical protein